MKTRTFYKYTINVFITLVSILLFGCSSNDSNPTNPGDGSPTTVAKILSNPSAYVESFVTLDGVIVAQIDDDEFWFKDGSQGEIKVEFSSGSVPSVGEHIKLSGRVKYDDGKLEVKVSSWSSLSSTPPPTFTFDKIGDIINNSGSYLYQVIALSGTITSRAGDDDDEFWFSDGTGTIKLDFPENGNYPSIGQNIVAVGTLTTDDGQLEVNVSYWQ